MIPGRTATHLSIQELLGSIVAFEGITTTDGAVGKTSLIDSKLISTNDWVTGKSVVILDNLAAHEDKLATAFTIGTGEVTFAAMSSRILAGTSYLILNIANPGSSLIAIIASLATILTAVTGEASFHVWQSQAGPVEHDAFEMFNISLIDTDTGAILQGDINITGITAVLEKSTGGADFSNVGITQPTFSKGDGRVYCSYRFLAAQWAVGDLYRLTVGGITAVIGAVTVYIPIQVWSNVVTELVLLDAKVTIIGTNQGDPSAQTLISTTAKIGDIARSLDLILGARWDVGGDLGTDIAAIIAEVQSTTLATGAGSNATLSRLGLLVRWLADNVAVSSTALSTTQWTNALATALGSYTAALAAALANYTAARAGYLDNLLGVVSTTGSPFSLVDNLNEQDTLIVAAATQLVDIELDLNTLTQICTIREYVKVDAANYRQISAKTFPADFDTGTKAIT
jgi:hypothetical protein